MRYERIDLRPEQWDLKWLFIKELRVYYMQDNLSQNCNKCTTFVNKLSKRAYYSFMKWKQSEFFGDYCNV